MSRIQKELAVRNARFEMLQEAMRNFREASVDRYGSYAYLAGWLETQLLTLAADRLDSTEDLLRDLNRSTEGLQKEAV